MSKHDKSVLRSANWYKNEGYKVKADVKGYNQPKEIKGFIPDVIAKKGKKEVILEIERPRSNEKDKEQQEAFKEYAEMKSNRQFKKKIV